MLELAKFKVAAVQAAPIFLDTDATVDKACVLIAEAAANGARLVAFPEVFIAGYPYWSWLTNPIEGSAWFERLVRSAITVPGPEIDRLRAAAKQHGCVVVIGCNERDPRRLGTLFNANLVIGSDGNVIGEPLIDVEDIVYADIDLSQCIQPKQMHDILGGYNRFDVFDLRVNRAPRSPASFTEPHGAEGQSLAAVRSQDLAVEGIHD